MYHSKDTKISITLVNFPAKFKLLVRFSFGHVTKWEISKITNKSELNKIENSRKSVLRAYNKNYHRITIFFSEIFTILENFEETNFFLVGNFSAIFT